MKSGKLPYLKPRRLEDIIQAVQAMGVHPRASRKDWESKLGKPLSAKTWLDVFSEHPEFFRVRGGLKTLGLRHTYAKTYDPQLHRDLSPEEVSRMTEDQKRKRLTPRPLKTDQIELLMRTAIQLHSRTIAQQKEKRWWAAILLTAIVAAISAAIGAAVQSLLGA